MYQKRMQTIFFCENHEHLRGGENIELQTDNVSTKCHKVWSHMEKVSPKLKNDSIK